MDTELHRILFSDQPYSFFIEIVLRTIIMFIAVIFALRVSGKRGVKQLSIFEMVMVIALGSAAGDPMFYAEVGILHAILVFMVILVTYRLLIILISHNEKAELFFEGKPNYLIRNGVWALGEVKDDEMGIDEIFSELRNKGIEHFGQIKYAIMETNGTVSVFYYEAENVKPGLPILPDLYFQKCKEIKKHGFYACAYCGNTEALDPVEEIECEKCKRKLWVLAIATKRVS